MVSMLYSKIFSEDFFQIKKKNVEKQFLNSIIKMSSIKWKKINSEFI